jgi:hypothetical protein
VNGSDTKGNPQINREAQHSSKQAKQARPRKTGESGEILFHHRRHTSDLQIRGQHMARRRIEWSVTLTDGFETVVVSSGEGRLNIWLQRSKDKKFKARVGGAASKKAIIMLALMRLACRPHGKGD